MVLPGSGILNPRTDVLTLKLVANFANNPTRVPRCMLIGVGTDLQTILAIWTNLELIPLNKRGRRKIGPSQTLLQPYATNTRSPETTKGMTQGFQDRQFYWVGYRLEKAHHHWRAIRRSPSRNSGHAGRVSSNVGWTFGPKLHRPTLHRTNLIEPPPHPLRSLLLQTENTRLKKDRN